jgi:MoaA/NifB/PqqE/SkfB family radical SAM enzyme
MGIDIGHAAERKAFEVVVSQLGKYSKRHRGEGYVKLVDMMQKVLGDGWRDEAYDDLREKLGKDAKWSRYIDNLIDNYDDDYLKGLMMSFGYEGALSGYRRVRKKSEEIGERLPWIILFDPTTACNLHCTGCWASEYEKTLNLSYEDMDKLITDANELGIHEFVMTGGEPMVRKKDILKLAKAHPDNGYMIFTNGTLVDQEFIDGMKEVKNILLIISIEGKEEATDQRRGKGVFDRIVKAMDLLKENGIVYGTSICYTRANYKAVTSDDFLDFLISKGVALSWYFHFMPVGNDASTDLVPTAEQRDYMYHRIREIRAAEGGKPIFVMDFQNDGEYVNGCIAGGKNYCHINANGDVEPCVFIHYSQANIHEKSLLECLQQPLFREYKAAQPFNDNMLRPCPMLENPEILRELVEKTGAKSTDMASPENVEHLCSKCDEYAKEWAPVSQKLWENSPRGKEAMEKKKEAADRQGA